MCLNVITNTAFILTKPVPNIIFKSSLRKCCVCHTPNSYTIPAVHLRHGANTGIGPQFCPQIYFMESALRSFCNSCHKVRANPSYLRLSRDQKHNVRVCFLSIAFWYRSRYSIDVPAAKKLLLYCVSLWWIGVATLFIKQ